MLPHISTTVGLDRDGHRMLMWTVVLPRNTQIMAPSWARDPSPIDVFDGVSVDFVAPGLLC